MARGKILQFQFRVSFGQGGRTCVEASDGSEVLEVVEREPSCSSSRWTSPNTCLSERMMVEVLFHVILDALQNDLDPARRQVVVSLWSTTHRIVVGSQAGVESRLHGGGHRARPRQSKRKRRTQSVCRTHDTQGQRCLLSNGKVSGRSDSM